MMSSDVGTNGALDATLISGSLTEGTGVTPVPEPSTLVLIVTAISGVSTTMLVKRLLSQRTAPREAWITS
jgi:hypothetical protein